MLVAPSTDPHFEDRGAHLGMLRASLVLGLDICEPLIHLGFEHGHIAPQGAEVGDLLINFSVGERLCFAHRVRSARGFSAVPERA